MTTVVQSAIKEVRDQLILDTADGEYLNNIGNNYGVSRPPIGFTDTLWRAIVKELALHYKQIKTKFESILAILFGPKTTVTSGLSAAASVGDMVVYAVDTSRMPQCGTLILDKGLVTEETVTYNFIHRQTNKILLDIPLTFAHNATNVGFSEPLILDASIGDTSLVFADVDYLDNLTTPFSLTLDVGVNEETVSVSNVDATTRTLTISPLTKNHRAAKPTVLQTHLTYDYNFDSFILQAASTKKFPDVGTIIASQPPVFSVIAGTTTTVQVAPGLTNPDQHIARTIIFTGNVTPALANVARTISTNSGTILSFAAVGTSPLAGDSFYIAQTLSATAGTATTVTVGSPTYTTGEQVGNSVCFVGNMTPALAGVVADVVTNTDTVLTFTNAITAPAVGDLFYIRPRLSYTRNSITDNAFIFRKRFPVDSIPGGTTIELISTLATGSNSSVLLAGVDWEVIQSDDRHVELLLPIVLNVQDIRSASYLHEGVPTPAATTLASPTTIGDTSVTVTSTSGFPRMGVFALAGTNYGYYVPDDITHIYESTGSTNLTINVLPADIPVNALDYVRIDDSYFPVDSNTAGSITFSSPLRNHIFASLVDGISVVSFVSLDEMTLTTNTIQANAIAGTAVSLYAPTYTSGTATGDLWDVADVFPGPNVYDTRENIPYNLDSITTLASKLAGPVRVEVDQNNFNNTLEVVDASFLPFSGYPHTARLGATTGNLEVVDITDVNLKQRVGTSVAVPSIVGATYIEVASLGLSGGSRFPNSRGYRVLVGEGTANEEVIYALSTDGVSVPPRINCEPTVNPHATFEMVRLLSDVVSVSGLSDVHVGYISYTDRKVRWPASITSDRITNAETLEKLYTSIPLTSSAGLDTSFSTALLNAFNMFFTQNNVTTGAVGAGSPSVTITDSTEYPTTGYPYPVVLGKSTYTQEIVLVTNNNVGAGVLSFISPTRYAHPAGTKVSFLPGKSEEITYSLLSGNSLSFLSPIVLKSNHYIGEPVVGSRISVTTLKRNGYDFPLRMPTDPAYQLEYLIDLVRAAGVKVTIIYAR